MAILHHGAYGASFYNLPNTLVGSYKSTGISVKTPCTQFQLRCSFDIPTNNLINIYDHPNGLKFCGMILDDNGTDENFNHGFVEYDLAWENDMGQILQTYWSEGQQITNSVTNYINIQDGVFEYTPCSFIIYFDFVINDQIQTLEKSFNDFEFDENIGKYHLKGALSVRF